MYPTPVATIRIHRPATSACTILGFFFFCCRCHSSSNLLKRSEVSRSIVCSGTSSSWSRPFRFALVMVGLMKLNNIRENMDVPIRRFGAESVSPMVSGCPLREPQARKNAAREIKQASAINCPCWHCHMSEQDLTALLPHRQSTQAPATPCRASKDAAVKYTGAPSHSRNTRVRPRSYCACVIHRAGMCVCGCVMM